MYTEDALKYLVGLRDAKVLDIDGKKFTTKDVYRITDPIPAALEITTLTALVDYIKSGLDKKSSENLLIHVKSPEKVVLYSELRKDYKRESYIECNALLPNNTRFNNFVSTDKFNIMLQSAFVDNTDKTLLLKVTGNIQENVIKQTGDDGVSQSAVVKTGVASVQEVVVPNPVTLAPYRTFPEIQQPESKFIFRMQSGPEAALYEADGGAWKNEAMQSIKSYLQENLEGLDNIKIIS